jgi:hypothetical protein
VTGQLTLGGDIRTSDHTLPVKFGRVLVTEAVALEAARHGWRPMAREGGLVVVERRRPPPQPGGLHEHYGAWHRAVAGVAGELSLGLSAGAGMSAARLRHLAAVLSEVSAEMVRVAGQK